MSAGAEELAIEAEFAAGSSDTLEIDRAALPFVSDVVYASPSNANSFAPARQSESGWSVACASGCRVHYRFALRRAAAAIDEFETAVSAGDVVVAPPSTWLLRPELTPGRFRFHVATSDGVRFVAATHPSTDGAKDTYEASTADFDGSSYSVFGPFHAASVASGSSHVDIAIAPAGLSLSDAEVTDWVARSVSAISSYAGPGRFPVERTLVVVQHGRDPDSTRGVTIGATGPSVFVRPGDHVNAASTRDDWVLTHELIHVVLPSLPRAQMWLSEGLATYLEPLVRLRAGQITPEQFWHDLVVGLPQGLPEQGDEGLDLTHTWGRTYWGGALFCLIADVTIRERTGNTRGLDDAVRAIIATGDDVETYWDHTRFLEVADLATGTTALHDLYRRLAEAPGTEDLPALWARLGVLADANGDRLEFNDSAGLAAVRRAIGGR